MKSPVVGRTGQAGQVAKPISVNALLKKLRAGNLSQPSLVKEGEMLDLAISLTGTTVIVYTKDREQLVEGDQLIKMATPPEEVFLYDLGAQKIWYSRLTSAEFHDYTTPDAIRTMIRSEVEFCSPTKPYMEINPFLAQQYLKHCTDLDIRTAKIPLHGAEPDSSETLEDLMLGCCNIRPEFTYTIAAKDGEGFKVEFWKRHRPYGAR